MKKYDIKNIKRCCIWITILVLCYTSCDSLLGRTYKYYFYSEDGKNSITILAYTAGDVLSLIKSCSPSYDPFKDEGRGIYIIPGKFTGSVPKDNYIRLDYIGTLPTNTIYFRWENDSLTLRLATWHILENKLPSGVKLDMKILEYERGWTGGDSITLKRRKDEWENMRKKHQFIMNKDIKEY